MNAFVSGGSRGIGRDIVLKFVRMGWGVAFTYAHNKLMADETVKLAKEINPNVKVIAYQLDVRNSDEVDNVVDKAIEDFDHITALVNNAAIVKDNAAALMSNEDWNDVIATNLTGPFYLARSFIMHFLSMKKGRIVNISSLAQYGSPGQVNYSAAKSGLIGLTQSLGKEYGAKGITSNVVTVGYVQTSMTEDHMSKHLQEFWVKHCPLKRIASGEEIANAVFFLSSDEGRFVNCEVLNVSGGLTYIP